MNGAAPLTYGGKQMRVRRGAICLIALFVASPNQESNQERGASKRLAPGAPYTHLLAALARRALSALMTAWRKREDKLAPLRPIIRADQAANPQAAKTSHLER